MGAWSDRREPARPREPASGRLLRLELLRDLDQGAGAAAGAPRLRHRGRARRAARRSPRAPRRSGCSRAADVAGGHRARRPLRPRPRRASAGLRAPATAVRTRRHASAGAYPAAALRPRQARDASRRCTASHVFPDSNAHGRGEAPQWLYTVVFDGRRALGPRRRPGRAACRSTPGRATLSPPDLPGLPRDAAGAPVFPGPGQARAFALAVGLSERGAFAWPEFSAALAEARAADPEGEYFAAWLAALEAVLARRAIATPDPVAGAHRGLAARRPGDAARRADPARGGQPRRALTRSAIGRRTRHRGRVVTPRRTRSAARRSGPACRSRG